MRLFGLTGYPLTHSFSKSYFEEKFRREGLVSCRFENFPLTEITDLPDLLRTYPDLEGLAVTIPHKKTVIPFLDSTEGIPPGLHACNCIRIRGGRLEGFNTDIVGFEKSFAPMLKPHHRKAMVLGNGGATAAVLFVLKKLGIEYIVVSRALHGISSHTYTDIKPETLEEHSVIINTTPLGMYPDVDTKPPIPYDAIGKDHLLFDLVYNPASTLFLQEGEKRGAVTRNGEEMLILQAEENWRIWNS